LTAPEIIYRHFVLAARDDEQMMNMKKIEEITNRKTVEWLLEKVNPSVRYFTLVDLLGKPENDREVVETKTAILETGLVPKILACQQEGGYWGDPDKFYRDKYRGTVWQVMILAELGAAGGDPGIAKACEFLLENSREKESSGFSCDRSRKEGGGLKSGVIPCLTGNMVWSLVRHGMLDDPRVQKGIEWICRYQRTDDGDSGPSKEWPYDRYEMCWGRHSCHMGVVKSLKALSVIPSGKRTDAVKEKTGELAEYLLRHHIFRKSHDLKKTAKPGWLRLGFPLMYQSDILEILEILTDLGYHDPRMQEAIGILRKKMTKEGRWIMENSFNGRMITNIETKGKESKWITLKALKVIGRF